MSGILPGVERARRGCFPRCRSRLGLHTTIHEAHLTANSMRITASDGGTQGGELGDIARLAKERLDERLRSQRAPVTSKGGTKRVAPDESNNIAKRETFKSPNSSKSSSDQVECVVCLEEFAADCVLVLQLPCGHRFHRSCVMPWLESCAHCPCCRVTVLNEERI